MYRSIANFLIMTNNKKNLNSINAAENMQQVINPKYINYMLDIKKEKQAQVEINDREWQMMEEVLERLLTVEDADYTMGVGMENFDVYEEFHKIKLHLMDVVRSYSKIATHLERQLDDIKNYIEKLEK